MKTFLVASAVLASWLAIAARGQAATPPDAEGAASALVADAARAYDQNQLDEALRLLARAYELSPRPSILYNQAQVFRAKDDCVAALDAYQRFIAATTPNDPNRERALLRRAEMQTCVDKRSGATKPERIASGAAGRWRQRRRRQPPPESQRRRPRAVGDRRSGAARAGAARRRGLAEPDPPRRRLRARPPSRDARHRLDPGRGRRRRGGRRRGVRLASAQHPGRAERRRTTLDPGARDGRGQTRRHPGAVVRGGRRAGRGRGRRAADRLPSDAQATPGSPASRGATALVGWSGTF